MAKQTIIVLDNSINSRFLWPDSENPANNDYALHVIQQASTGAVFYVPTIWHYELTQVAYTLTRKKIVSQAATHTYFNQLAGLPIMTDSLSHANSANAGYALCLQYGLSSYDSAYLELALRLGAYLATNDADLMKAADKAGVALLPRDM